MHVTNIWVKLYIAPIKLKREFEGDLLNDVENVLFFFCRLTFIIFVLIYDVLMRYFKACVIYL